MSLTSVLKPSGFRPVGSGELLYTFLESTIVAKPNYRVEIELDGLGLPVFQFRPNADLEIECNIAPLLRAVLEMSPTVANRFKNTYVKYQAVWDTGSDAQVPLSSDIIYFCVGSDNDLNHRTQFEITSSAGDFLVRDNILHAWPGRTAYIEWLNSITSGWVLEVIGGSTYYGNGTKELVSIPVDDFTVDTTAMLKSIGWASGVSVADNTWRGVAYGAGLFVAISSDGANRVMTSPDGLTWTARTAAAANTWTGVCYGNGLFVAVSLDGASRVMTSPDGITWTSRTAAAAKSWQAVAYGNGLFVAVANDADTATIMTSPDGITWTGRTASEANQWGSLVYGGSTWVVLGKTGTHRVMTSADGITWANQTAAEANPWQGVAYANGLFVGVASTGTHRVMTSVDGATWVSRTAAEANPWLSIVYADGIFVAVANSGTNRIMLSTDGISWNAVPAAAANQWWATAFGGGITVVVGISGTGNRVMYSALSATIQTLTVTVLDECANPIYLKWLNDYGGLSTWLFDVDQGYSLSPEDTGRSKELEIFALDLTMGEWLTLEELNRDGVEYGDNQKLGAYVVDFTDENDPINIVVLPSKADTRTRKIQHSFVQVIRYPLIDNIDI